MHGLFITGADTGVGKTRVACALIDAARAGGVRTGAYKPVCSGMEIDARRQPVWEDAAALKAALGDAAELDEIAPQRFRAALAPPLAAALEGRAVDYAAALAGAKAWSDRCELLIVEGAGGLLCPLTDWATMADLARDLGFPLVVVSANRLGTVNHTLLTLEALRSRGLALAAVVLNDVQSAPDDSAETNAQLIEQYASIPCLCRMPHASKTVHTRRGPVTGLDLIAWAARRA